MSTEEIFRVTDPPIYLFSLRATERDISGYYFPRWDRARPLEVRATTEREALTKADALLPVLRSGWAWAFLVDSVTEAPVGSCNHCACKEDSEAVASGAPAQNGGAA